MEPGLFPAPEPQAAAATPPTAANSAAAEQPGLSERQRLILSRLDTGGASVDLIVERTELPANVVLQELTFLSLKGQVRRIDGQTYARSRGAAT
jgi:predicted Rossmann fold nucleotide-binding protein DprA/Smf involved in DNA uptake